MSGTTTGNVVINVSSAGVPTVRRDLASIGMSAQEARRAVYDLHHALQFIGLSVTLKDLVHRIDSITALGNKMQAVGIATENVGIVFNKLLEISNRTYTSVEMTGNMFSRLQLVMDQFGYSTNDAIRVTNALSTALSLSGATRQEATYGLMDLVHGLTAGSINSRELRGMMQALPAVVKALADGLGVTVGKLQEMIHSKEKLTSDQVFQAFLKQENELIRRQAELVPTLTNAFTVLSNQFNAFLGGQVVATGAAGDLARAILVVANNITGLALAIEYALLLFLSFRVIPGILMGIAASLATLAATNPMLLFVGGVYAAILAITLFRDHVRLGIDETTTLGDLIRAAWEKVAPIIQDAMSGLSTILSDIRGQFSELTPPENLLEWIREAMRLIDTLAAYVGAGMRVMVAAWDNMGLAVKDIVITLANALVGYFESAVNTIIAALNSIPNAVSSTVNGAIGLIDRVRKIGYPGSLASNFEPKFQTNIALPTIPETSLKRIDPGAEHTARVEKARQELTTMVDSLAGIVRQADAGNGMLATALDGIVPRAQELSKIRDIVAKAREWSAAQDLARPGKGGFSPHHDNKGADKISHWLDQILGKFDPVTKATRAWEKEQMELKKALDMGLISLEQYNRALIMGAEFVKDKIDPLGHVNRLMEEQIRLYGLVGDAQRAETEFARIRQDLIRRGVILTEQQSDALKKQLGVLEEAQRRNSIGNNIWQQFGGARETFASGLEVANSMLQQGKLSADEYSQAIRDIEIAYLKTATDGVSGLKLGFLEVQKTAGDTASIMSGMVHNMFSNFEEAIVQFAQTGKLSFKNLADAFEADLIRMAMRVLVTKPILDLIFGAGNVASVAGGAASSAGGAGFAGLGGLLGSVTSWVGGLFGGGEAAAGAVDQGGWDLPGFAGGGGFIVPGSGGTDSKVVSFRATPGERVDVRTPDQMKAMSGGDGLTMNPTFHYNIYANDPNAFRRTQDQTIREAGRLMATTMHRNRG